MTDTKKDKESEELEPQIDVEEGTEPADVTASNEADEIGQSEEVEVEPLDEIDIREAISDTTEVHEQLHLAASEVANLPAIKEGLPPTILVVFPLRRSVPFPSLIMPVLAEAGDEVAIMEKAMAQGRHIGLLHAPGMSEKQGVAKADFAVTGVLAEVHKRIRLPDGNSNYICRGVRRFRVDRFVKLKGVPVARVSYPEDIYPPGNETEALSRNVLSLAQKVASHNPSLGDGFNLAALNIDPAGGLADFSAAYLLREPSEKQPVLDELNVRDRLHTVDEALTRELVTLELGDRIQAEIRERIEQQQKEFFLREQIKIIRRELGEEQDPPERDRELFLNKLEEGDFPAEVAGKVKDEIERLSMIPSMSPEYPVARNYIEWLLELPWMVASDDRIDIDQAEMILDRDHYGLKEAKERILEFLGVRKLRPEHSGAILCFVGPPGVGKTSLAMAIAESMGRQLERMSLGGMRDEAEIKGHRRTYVGALPGRIMQMVRRAGTNNPVIVLDEVDKLGKDFRGDPSSALLEVLDPAQNKAFLDLYLDLPFDLSRVMFIATANVLHEIPGPLRDRMEVIALPGYVTAEKVQIARRHLLPRQMKDHGLDPKKIKLPLASLRAIVNSYTREAGVRGLEKFIANLCRKRTLEVARRKRPKPEIPVTLLEKYLGPPKYEDDPVRLKPDVGVALGLAYTAYGGDVLEIECVTVQENGKGTVGYTGSLGDVMSESCRIAHSYLRSQCQELDLEGCAIQSRDLHVHFPSGAVPKDGPSAGITITCAMLSQLSGRKLKPRLAMTGEITLTGEVLPVGGIREKVLAAKRYGVKQLILPKANERDVKILDPEWTSGMSFHFVGHFNDVVDLAFTGPNRKKSRS
ncbi:MAG: endopeptidase La [Planctomycetes bacterium]|nr:endopeptidase La [Planctomycetota bacterium]